MKYIKHIKYFDFVNCFSDFIVLINYKVLSLGGGFTEFVVLINYSTLTSLCLSIECKNETKQCDRLLNQIFLCSVTSDQVIKNFFRSLFSISKIYALPVYYHLKF